MEEMNRQMVENFNRQLQEIERLSRAVQPNAQQDEQRRQRELEQRQQQQWQREQRQFEVQTSAALAGVEVPDYLTCPISLALMREPVITPSGGEFKD